MTENSISWTDFEKIDIRVWTIIRAELFEKAKNPAYKIWVDFWWEIGIKKSSAQITTHYTIDKLIGKQIIGVINFPPKQISDFMSEFLCTWFKKEDGSVILAIPEKNIPNWSKLL